MKLRKNLLNYENKYLGNIFELQSLSNVIMNNPTWNWCFT
jgi:hypothetical protein